MHIAIVEDYPPVAASIERKVREIWGERISSVHRFEKSEEFLDIVASQPIDLLLLDLNLGGSDGFDLLKQLTAHTFYTVVISANTQRALEAFEYGVLDFVPKPVDTERLRQALGRIDGADTHDVQPPKFFSVRGHGSLRLVPVADVDFIKGAGKYSELHLADGTIHLHNKTLDQLEILLQQDYRRLHRSYLAKLSLVQRIRIVGGGSYEAELGGSTVLPVARSRYNSLKDELG